MVLSLKKIQVMEIKEPAVAYNRLISIEDFLGFAEKREERLEYIDGEISMMSSTSKAHSIITCNLNRKLYEFLKG
jgi:Uma2 family endonuclease